MQMTETVGQFVVFVGKKKKCPVNLEHVINSSDSYRRCGNLKSKQSDKTWEFPYS